MPSSDMSKFPRSIDAPARGGFAVTPSDSTVFDNANNNPPARALWVGGAGNIAVRFIDQSQVTLSGVAAGTILPVNVDKVLATGTTATLIVGLF